MFTPSCLPILIGSLPLNNHQEATRLVLTHTPEIPLWVQLPKLPKEGMIRQFINGLPGLTEEGSRFWVDSGHDRFTEEMTLFYQDYMEEMENPSPTSKPRFALTTETASGFFTLIQTLEEGSQRSLGVKGQVTGPMTTGIGVKNQHGNSIFYDDNLKDIVVKLITMKARWQVARLKPFSNTIPPIIFIDEPGIVSFGSTAYNQCYARDGHRQRLRGDRRSKVCRWSGWCSYLCKRRLGSRFKLPGRLDQFRWIFLL